VRVDFFRDSPYSTAPPHQFPGGFEKEKARQWQLEL
jgi:hypothetical protein